MTSPSSSSSPRKRRSLWVLFGMLAFLVVCYWVFGA